MVVINMRLWHMHNFSISTMFFLVINAFDECIKNVARYERPIFGPYVIIKKSFFRINIFEKSPRFRCWVA